MPWRFLLSSGAACLIEQIALPVEVYRGQIPALLGWLNVLPDALVRTSARLCIYHAIVLMFTNHLEEAEERLEDAEKCIQSGMPAEEQQDILSQIALVRANMSVLLAILATVWSLPVRHWTSCRRWAQLSVSYRLDERVP